MKVLPLKELLTEPIKNGYSPICVEDCTGKWVLGLGSLNGNGLNLKEIKPVPADNTKIDSYILRAGDFLVSRSNTLDKVGRAALFRGGIENCAYSDLMMRFRVNEKEVYPDFLDEYLRSAVAQKYFRRCAAGTSGSMVKITKSTLEKLEIKLPNLKEQVAISIIAREASALIEKTEALIAAKETQFQWLKKHLFDRNFQSCDERLANFASILKHEKITSVEGLKPLIVKLHCKGIKANDRDIQIILSDKGRPYFQRKSGDFLIGRQNFHNGGFGIVPQKLDGFIASNAITTLDINPSKLDAQYLFYFFSRKDYYLRIGHIMDGTGQKELSDKQIMKLPVSVPNLEKQQEVVQILNTAKKEIDLLNDLTEQYRTQKRGLMQKLLTGEWRVKSEMINQYMEG